MKELSFNKRFYWDLELASEFYESQEPGCGDYFNRSILADVQSLHSLHGIHRKHCGFHQMHATRFPFTIYYRVTATAIEVMAVLDQRRDPQWIRRQLRSR
jgi:hypothetical protein